MSTLAPHTFTTTLLNNAKIAHDAGCWSFNVAGWQPPNISKLDKRCRDIDDHDLVILYCSEPGHQGIVMMGHVDGRTRVDMWVRDLWPGEFRNMVPMIWWNVPTVLPKDQLKQEMPLFAATAANWQLTLNTIPMNFPNRVPSRLTLPDIYYLMDALPVDTSIPRVKALLRDRSTAFRRTAT